MGMVLAALWLPSSCLRKAFSPRHWVLREEWRVQIMRTANRDQNVTHTVFSSQGEVLVQSGDYTTVCSCISLMEIITIWKTDVLRFPFDFVCLQFRVAK